MTRFGIRRLGGEAGYSLLEMMLTVGIMSVVSGMAAAQIGNTRPALKGDGAMRVVMAQLNTARELAISQRRYIDVNFINSSQVQLVREEYPGPAVTTLSTIPFEGGVTFALAPSVPDTPDSFGNESAVSFGTATTLKFTPEGMLVDQNGNPLNGTVFTVIPNEARSARAVTVFGSTGRVRGYRWDLRQWKLV